MTTAIMLGMDNNNNGQMVNKVLGNKASDNHYDMVDRAILHMGDRYAMEFFHRTGHTPNVITTYAVVFKFLACYALWKENIKVFVLSVMLAYIFDCFDGQYARRYNMVTEFGIQLFTRIK